MYVVIAVLAVVSFLVLVITAAIVARSFRRSRDRRRTATPSGVLYGPTDAELRRTREIHPVIPGCDGFVHSVSQIGRVVPCGDGCRFDRGEVLTTGEGENAGKKEC